MFLLVKWTQTIISRKNIVCDKIDISNNDWIITNATILNINGMKEEIETLEFTSNFDLNKINNLFSNLSSLNLYQLKSHYDDYKSLGYSTLDIESYINELLSVPFLPGYNDCNWFRYHAQYEI